MKILDIASKLQQKGLGTFEACIEASKIAQGDEKQAEELLRNRVIF